MAGDLEDITGGGVARTGFAWVPVEYTIRWLEELLCLNLNRRHKEIPALSWGKDIGSTMRGHKSNEQGNIPRAVMEMDL